MTISFLGTGRMARPQLSRAMFSDYRLSFFAGDRGKRTDSGKWSSQSSMESLSDAVLV